MADESRWLTDKYWLSPYNFEEEVRNQFTLPKRVYIHDVTLREASQSPHVCLLGQEKLRIARALDELGVDSIEIGPYFSSEEKEVTQELVKMHRSGELKAKVTPLAHWTEKDIDLVLECGADRVIISHNVNPWSTKHAFGMDEAELIERLTRVVSYAKKNGLFTVVQTFDTYKAPMEFLERLEKSLVYEGGADHVAISDTYGSALPWTITFMVRKLRSWIPGVPIEHHGHNDFGLATAMMLAAVAGGAEVVHTSVNNLGERVGNAATEEVAMALELLLGVKTGIHLHRIYPVCELVSELSKMPIARNKPITGENEFLYGSGMVIWRIWQLAKQGRPFATMPYMPEVIGRKDYEVIFGLGTGRAVVRDRLTKMGLSATEEQIGEIVNKIKAEAYIRKSSVPDFEFEEIVKRELGK